MLSKQLTDDFWWVGNLDPDLRVFDIVMHTDHGTSYNSYILKGKEKTVLFEAAKASFFDVYMAKLAEVVPLEEIDILVCNHTEPDHSGTIEKMLEINPKLQIVGTTGALNFLKEITNKEIGGTAVRDGDEIDIGGRTLRFITAPNLHWPDTMFTYIPEEKILVTCDAFGAHFSYENIVNDEFIDHDALMKTTIYYFDNIMGPFKADVLRACEKIRDLEIEIVANGHGPVLVNNPRRMIDFYESWAGDSARNEKKTVVIAYVSAYGYTKLLAKKIGEGLRAAGDIDVKFYDMVYADLSEVMAEIGRADGFLLGTPTIVGEALPPIWNVATELNAKVHGGKFAGVFGSYGWSGEGVPHIMERLRQLKLQIVGDGFRVRFKPSEEDEHAAFAYGEGFGAAVTAGKLPAPQAE
ncbi:MAG: FprA family A-type flavoprotein [Clostridiales Family XIII bacterium]|jgi:flavorubredoxin|nr:FprA family A-type flavoprotein [Clostridiales Family XIII bacterium]